MDALLELLENRAEAVVSRWRDRVGAPSENGGSGPELFAQVRGLLQGTALALRGGREGPAPRIVQGGELDLQRAVHELGVLREVVLELAEESPAALTNAALRTLSGFFAAAIAEVVSAHALKERQAEMLVVEMRAAQETTRRLHSLFTQAPVGFAVFQGPRYVIEQANRTVCRIWGRKPEEVLGKPLFEALPEAAGQGFEELLDAVLGTGVAYVGKELPARIARLEGGGIEDVYFNFVYEPLRSTTGQVEGVIVVATDATDEVRTRKAQAEAAAAREHESAQRLGFALETAGLGQWNHDLQSGRLEVSAGFKTNLGLRPEDELPSLERLRDMVHPDDRPKILEALAHALRERGNYEAEYRVVNKPGALRWVLSRGRVICDALGVPTSVTGINLNITERKNAELERELLLQEVEAARARLENLFESAPAFVCTLRGPTHLFEMVNPHYQSLVGETRVLIGRPVAEALPEVVGQGFIEQLDRVFRTGEAFVGKEVRIQIARAGPTRLEEAYLSFVYQSTRNIKGEIDGIDVFGFDVTDHVRARERAQELAGQLRQRVDFEQQLIGIVSHDLRDPMNAILMGAAALLRGQELTDRHTKNVVRIQNSAERAHRLIRDLLDFTQARVGGGIHIERRSMNLHNLLRGLVDEAQASHASRELQTSFTGRATGLWDPDRLAQIIQNLLGNALKYSPEGTPIHLETRSDEGSLSISIHNLGPAIPAEQLGTIFLPLRRAANARDRTGSSIGLGLYIVQQMVDAHGGTVKVESTAARGTTFTVRLPDVPDLPEQAAPLPEAPQH